MTVPYILTQAEYYDFVKSRAKWLTEPGENLAHAGMGLLGECVELAQSVSAENTVEELGDLEFYTAHFYLGLEKANYAHTPTIIERPESQQFEKNPTYHLTLWAGDAHDKAKKCWIYKRNPQDIDFNKILKRVELCLHFLAERAKTTRATIWQHNKSKLEERYPSGYSDKAALARADKKEGE